MNTSFCSKCGRKFEARIGECPYCRRKERNRTDFSKYLDTIVMICIFAILATVILPGFVKAVAKQDFARNIPAIQKTASYLDNFTGNNNGVQTSIAGSMPAKPQKTMVRDK